MAHATGPRTTAGSGPTADENADHDDDQDDDAGGARGADFLQLDVSQAPPRAVATWLTERLRTAITSGRVPAGAALPATRALAADLGVARGTVAEAYRRLGEEGLTSARTSGGTRVSVQVPVIGVPATPPAAGRARPAVSAPRPARGADGPPGPLPLPPEPGIHTDLSPGLPDLSLFPRAAWLRAEREVLATTSHRDLGYGDPRGHPRLREALVVWLARTRGIDAVPDDVLVVSGVAQGLALLAQTLARSTRSIAVEDPGSRGARDELEHWGLRPVGVPVDGDGLDVAALEATRCAAVLVTPAHQFPTGVLLAPQRRQQLLTWARRDGHLVVEDDYDAEHRYDRPPAPALHTSAPEHVVHTGSTSKTLAPALRLGWVLAPEHLRGELLAAKHASDLGSPVLPQLVLARLVEDGGLERHLRAVRRRHRERRDALLAAVAEHLPDAAVHGVPAGLHLVLTLPDRGGRDVDLAARAAAAGVRVHPLSWHRVAPRPEAPGLVIGYAAHTRDQLHRAVRAIALARRSGPP